MNLSQFSGTNLIELELKSKNKNEVIKEIAELLSTSEKVVDAVLVRKAIEEREELASTGIGFGVALPHARSKAVKGLTIVFGRSEKGIEFGSIDQKPVHLIFAIVVPEWAVNTHLTALGKLSLLLKESENRAMLLNATFPQDILDFIKRHSSSVALGIALLAAVLLSQSPIGVKAGVARIFMNTIFYPFESISGTYHLLYDRRVENLKLKEELTAARLKIENLKEAGRENERLRKELEFTDKCDYYAVLAEVLGHGSARISGSIVVGAGADKNIIEGLPVIDAFGVVGKVITVYKNTCVVQLISDPNLKISAIDGRSRAQGIVAAATGGILIIENVPSSEDILRGDPIVTSGLGGVFPKGLLIGSVSRIIVPQTGLFSKVELAPAARISTLEEVFILQSALGLKPERPVETDSTGGTE